MKKMRASTTGVATRRTGRTLLAVVVLVAGFGVVASASPAFAINQVPCDSDEYLKVWGHLDGPLFAGEDGSFELCAANAGTLSLGEWVDQISTGNNDVRYFDRNGAVVDIPRWHVVTYPNSPPLVDRIEIR